MAIKGLTLGGWGISLVIDITRLKMISRIRGKQILSIDLFVVFIVYFQRLSDKLHYVTLIAWWAFPSKILI